MVIHSTKAYDLLLIEYGLCSDGQAQHMLDCLLVECSTQFSVSIGSCCQVSFLWKYFSLRANEIWNLKLLSSRAKGWISSCWITLGVFALQLNQDNASEEHVL